MLELELIKKIPIHIIYFNIIPYTYSIQSSFLLLDIKNFNETKKIIFELYYLEYSYLLKYEKNADKNWLVSDIVLFTKKNKISLYKKINRLYNEFMCLNKYLNKCINYLFNIFWSYLIPNERDSFIKIMKNRFNK
jgi:hypothetical protein